MLGVLMDTASRYYRASFDITFKKVKIHFVHGHGKNNARLIVAFFSFIHIILGSVIRQCTMPAESEEVYLMHKVDKAEIPASTGYVEEAL